MNQTNVDRHVHVNGYRVNDDLERKFLGIGFFPDPFKKLERGSTNPMLAGARFMPPYHYSFETENLGDMDNAFDAAVEAIRSDGNFEGYVESETIPDSYNIRFDSLRLYNRTINENVLLPQFDLVRVPEDKHKACDIHMKRSGDAPRDELDDILLGAGCYEVHTPRSRIFTLQFESVRDGAAVFNFFRDYFSKVGCMKHIYLEVTKDMYKEPSDFEFVPFVRKGSLYVPYGISSWGRKW